ncbi:MAG: rRNA maturation RNase YbeY [Gammaproteobacteria bacterium]
MVRIDLQNEESIDVIPDLQQLTRWVESSLLKQYDNLEQTIRVVDDAESRALNLRFRKIDAPTNVLSFPASNDYLDYQCLGDLVICAPVVATEALQQAKPQLAHWAHMVVHGMLHLQGFDHRTDTEAKKMEALEVEILSTLGYINPYNA